MTGERPSRRELLGLLSAGSAAGVAGCGFLPSAGSSRDTPAESSADTGTTAAPDATDTPSNRTTVDPSECPEIGGSVEAGTTLDGCYRVMQTLDVADGTLTIAPGSRLIFMADTGLEVREEGSIAAVGSEAAPITMDGATTEPGYWKGVAIHSQQPSNELRFVEISSAGSGRWDSCCPYETRTAGLNVWDNGILTLQQSTLANNAGYGLSVASSADLRAFQSNRFSENGTAAIATTADNLAALDAASDYGDGVVEVGAADVTESGRWVPINGTYRMSGRPQILDDAVVTIEAGSTFVFAEDAGIRVVSGALAVAGDPDAPVVMRGETATSGFWRGLSIQSKQPANRLEYLELAHGGSDNWDPCCPNDSAPANLNVFDDAIASVVNVTFRDSSNYGMVLAASSELQVFERNAFANNAEASLWLTATNLGSLDAASDYGEQSVAVVGTDVTDDATWKAVNTSYDVQTDSTLTVTDGADITIQPGTVFAFRENAGLRVEQGGSLSAVGTETDRISFTGTTAAPGWWAGIAITSPATGNEIGFADVAHGGSRKWDPCCPNESRNANVNVFDGGYLSLRNARLSASENYATWVYSDSTLDGSGNDYGGDPTGLP